jgi:short-subunit dehydrogenase
MMNKTGSYIGRLSVMNPEDVVPVAIDGLLKGKEVIIPGKLNNFFMLLDKVLPAAIKKLIASQGMKKLNHTHSLIPLHIPAMIPVVVPISSG